jgi:hypothetical protein
MHQVAASIGKPHSHETKSEYNNGGRAIQLYLGASKILHIIIHGFLTATV